MQHKPYRYLLYFGLRLLEAIVMILPREAALAVGHLIARVAFLLAHREREKTLLHLRQAFEDEKSEAQIRKIGQGVFDHFAQVAVDVLRFPLLDRQEVDRLIDFGDGLSVFQRLLSEGRGVIVMTGHFGNWELLAAAFRCYGYQATVVGRRLSDTRFNEIIIRLRQQAAFETLYQDAPPREFLKILKKNQLLGMLVDQDLDRFEGIFVPFFGRPAYTLTTPVKLALATKAPIVPTFLVRTGKRYRLVVEEPIRVEMKENRGETILEYTAQWTKVFEKTIRETPDQWAWMHRRWRTQPENKETNGTNGTISWGDRSA